GRHISLSPFAKQKYLVCFLGYIHSLTLVCNCIKLLIISEIFFFLQEKDAALGNGGLGRLASCFLDSMATLNLPAWGYGLSSGLAKRAKKKLSKTDLRSLAIGKLSDMTLCSLSDFLVKLKYIPLDRYKTKNTINLHLWEAKAGAEDFNLFQFNDGQYESAAQLHFRAQQVDYMDATENGKLLRLKQQFFLCSASLQERKDGKSSWQWYEFPNKVVVQLNDTHPTLAIPELMRLLIDDDGLGWDKAWDVTTRAIAYTNHTVLPEALEKCSQAVMWKLLPHHMEIIEEIDKRFIAMIRSTKPELESKLSSMRIMDNNPQKPVVRMANLCVVSSHTVNGVAQLHSDILKSELFADYVSIWPKKFQNKTNGITPRRWL
ncbi:hypothetical protein HYC85_015329, partial [Camellia sinensis]